jgi:hypothetical protein
MVFFQPEVLMANPGLAPRLKQMCGGACPMVVLQGNEPIARALQADDYLVSYCTDDRRMRESKSLRKVMHARTLR